ncbi:MAG: hypothetical protein LBC70_08855 [Chitinispirillales bacterium]|jgi:hypothetical protein|nr:hypothetical protein [Chitinispirillales bacterium]
MSVNTNSGVTGSGATNAYYQNLNTKRTGGTDAATGAGTDAVNDRYTAGGDAGGAGGVYSRGSTNAAQRLWNMAETHYAAMRSAVEGLLGGTSGQNGQAFWAMAAGADGGPKFEDFRVDDATRAKAQEMIGEDGYYGVRRTTERIMEFAEALAGAGASPETIENLRKGVQAGFDYVAGLFGGFDKLPQVTQDTHTAVMQAFDDWVSGGKAVGA